MSKPRSQRDAELLAEIREVAKLGLDDPDRLAELKLLLDHPAVRSFEAAAGPATPTRRCRALADALLKLVRELTMLDSTQTPDEQRVRWERKVTLDGLFMLTDKWKGIGITNRRQMLAGLEPDEDTSKFRRTTEEPLYRLILAHLDAMMGQVEDINWVDEEQSKAVSLIAKDASGAALSINLAIQHLRTTGTVTTNDLRPLRDFFKLLSHIVYNRLDLRQGITRSLDETSPFLIAISDLTHFHVLSWGADLDYCLEKHMNAFRRESDCFLMSDFSSDAQGKTILKEWRNWMEAPTQDDGPEQFIDACISLIAASISESQFRLSPRAHRHIEDSLSSVREQVAKRRAGKKASLLMPQNV